MTRSDSIRAYTYVIGIAVITLAAAIGGSCTDAPVQIAVPTAPQQSSML